jgi:glycosyltransferase involved in cell wall biosynthesis
MKLSVVIPTFNRATLLKRALQSVVVQSLPVTLDAMQIIVVDDGSTDNTESMVKGDFPEVVYIKQPNLGVSAARNRGLKVAAGDWLALLDSDDEWLANKLQKQFQLLQSSMRLVCHTEEIWIRNGVRVNQRHKHQKSGGWIFEKCLPLCAMSPSSMVIHRSIFEKVGWFDESLPACEDYDLWLRISAHYPVDFVAEPSINKYGGHADQLSRQHWGMDRFRVQALDNILAQPLVETMYNAALEMRNTKLEILLKGAIKHGNKKLIAECERKLCQF